MTDWEQREIVIGILRSIDKRMDILNDSLQQIANELHILNDSLPTDHHRRR